MFKEIYLDWFVQKIVIFGLVCSKSLETVN
jgi:hypothetical protein